MSDIVVPPADAAPTVGRALSAPFEAAEVKFKPAVVSGNRALALAYVDARVIQDRLDDVLGVAGWQDGYRVLPDGSVMCRLRLKIGGQWITKVDVGGQSEQPDGGDRTKAAFSDALKRAAVKFGVGRYLYRLPPQWVEYDPQKRQLKSRPALPAWALPPRRPATPLPCGERGGRPPAAAPDPPAEGPAPAPDDLAARLARAAERHGCAWRLPALLGEVLGPYQAADRITAAQAQQVANRLGLVRRYWHEAPPDGARLRAWLDELDARVAHEGGAHLDVLRFARETARQEGLDYDGLDGWPGPGRQALWKAAKKFAEQKRAAAAAGEKG